MSVETEILAFKISVKDRIGEEIGSAHLMCDSDGDPEKIEITVVDRDYEPVIEEYNIGDNVNDAVENLEWVREIINTLITELKKYQKKPKVNSK